MGRAEDLWSIAVAADAGRAAARLGAPRSRLRDLELAIHEALTNAFEHGHLADPARPIRVEVERVDRATVVVRVADDAVGGRWHPARGATPPVDAGDVLAERGRGLRLMDALVDAVVVRAGDGRTVVELHVGAEDGAGRRSRRVHERS